MIHLFNERSQLWQEQKNCGKNKMGAREAQPSMLLMGVKCLAHAQEYNTMTRLRFKPRPLDIESSTSPFERQLRVQC